MSDKIDDLTTEQIENWRRLLSIIIGPYARIMSDDQVQKFKDSLQDKIDEDSKEI